jgi:subtilisin
MKKNNWSLLPYDQENIYGLTPQDQQFFGWEIEKFNIPKQWKKSEGENVVVAVIDTGCDLYHDDLKTNLIQGMNFVERGKDPIDRCGHGSHVAGTIAACNNGLGMVGVAPKAKIMPIKALNDSGNGSSQDIANSIIWAVDNHADLITMSLGSPSSSPAIYNAIVYAANHNVGIFCAAGNSGEDVEIMYPAKYEETISIGAIDRYLNRTNFTCSGEELDFLAPGHDIVSCIPGNAYSSMSGTSMSNPFAAGCAALALSYFKKNGSKLPKSKQDFVDLFAPKAKSLQNPRYAGIKKYQGYGIMYPIL